jgi:hypothetical protein
VGLKRPERELDLSGPCAAEINREQNSTAFFMCTWTLSVR